MSLSFRTLTVLAAIGATLCIALLGLRIANTISLDEPLHLITSGAEWESLFAIWKAINGQEVYTDRLQIPYHAVVYNWLFYEAYAWFTGILLGLLSLSDPWLPTIGRLFTVLAAMTGILVCYAVFVRLFQERDAETRVLSLSFAVFVMTGPLIGWWAFTVRSDIWALALDIMAAGLFLKYYPRQKYAAVALLVTFGYAAWSFKQMYVFAVGAGGLLLLARRDWKLLGLLAGAMISAWAITFIVGNAQYVENVLFSDFTLFFAFSKGLRNIANFSIKSTPTLAALAALGVIIRASPHLRIALWRDDPTLFALGGVLVAGMIALPASFQTGGAEHYFFAESFYLALASVAGFALLRREKDGLSQGALGVASLGWVALSVALLLVLAGIKGITDVREQHVNNKAWKECLADLPRPLYVATAYMALPWMTENEEHFVVSYQYPMKRKAGKVFEAGGIGGLIAADYFKTLALNEASVPKELDGARLETYRHLPGRCPGLTILVHPSVAPEG
jgi:hypothetical protein